MIEYDRSWVSSPKYGAFFKRYWARSIIRNHDALRGFLQHRREAYPFAYIAFTTMAIQAEKIAGSMSPPQDLQANKPGDEQHRLKRPHTHDDPSAPQ
jgi:hypothetical protein